MVDRDPAVTEKGRKATALNYRKYKNYRGIEILKSNLIEYIKRKSLLYKTGVEYGDYTINHVLGCSHGCLYPCYAMLMARRFGKVTTYEEWLKPKIVENAIELLKKEIPNYKTKIKLCSFLF